MSIQESAIAYHNSGCNCAQSVLAALQEELEAQLETMQAGSDAAMPLEESCDALIAAQELLTDAVDACEEAEQL